MAVNSNFAKRAPNARNATRLPKPWHGRSVQRKNRYWHSLLPFRQRVGGTHWPSSAFLPDPVAAFRRLAGIAPRAAAPVKLPEIRIRSAIVRKHVRGLQEISRAAWPFPRRNGAPAIRHPRTDSTRNPASSGSAASRTGRDLVDPKLGDPSPGTGCAPAMAPVPRPRRQ